MSVAANTVTSPHPHLTRELLVYRSNTGTHHLVVREYESTNGTSYFRYDALCGTQGARTYVEYSERAQIDPPDRFDWVPGLLVTGNGLVVDPREMYAPVCGTCDRLYAKYYGSTDSD